MAYASVSKPQSKKAAPVKRGGKRQPVPVHQKVAPGAGLGTGFQSLSLPIQAKLKIGEANDKYEQEADRVAAQVMRMPESQVKRQFEPMEEEEETLQTKSETSQVPTVTPSIHDGISRLRQSVGSTLPASTRAFMEPRFGHDFTNVKIHTGSQAADLSRSVNARAFTVGHDIFFNQGEYQPTTVSGMRLLVHELTHVVQQNGADKVANSIQRTVSAKSKCASNTHNAPADPLARLEEIDATAQRLAFLASDLLSPESAFGGFSDTFNAYRDWFGTPQQLSSGKWKSRFRKTPFATEQEAITHEMQVLSNQFYKSYKWLQGNVRYICPGTHSFKLPGGCKDKCKAGYGAISCPGGRTIAICPDFWSGNNKGLPSLLIHESLHARSKRFSKHSKSIKKRIWNTACYQGFVDKIFNTGSSPLSKQCTALPSK